MADMGYPFRDCVAVVTGASRGIGRETAVALARAGCQVVMIARPSDELDQAVASIRSAGQIALAHPCDLSDASALDRLVQDLCREFPRIDILVNCAGVGKFGPLASLTPGQARAPLLVPLQATVVLSQGLLARMKGSGRGRIINVIAPAAYFDLPWMAAYTASRAGLLSFSRALDEELSADGIRVKTVCPAWVETDYLSHNQTDGDWLPRVARYFPTVSASQAAASIVEAIAGKHREAKLSWLLRLCAFSYRLFPRLSVNAFKLLCLYRPPALDSVQQNVEGGSVWTNWEESISLQPAKTVFPESVEEVCRIISDRKQYPSPIRPAGSRHSTTHCGVTDRGTLMIMRRMDRILRIDKQTMTVTAQAGALYIDVADALRAEGLQFYVNVEIGNLTMGSAASTGTKDASMPGENGQVCSYCIGVKMVTADGKLIAVTAEQPELLQKVRSSYGLLGAIVETSFRVRSLDAMVVYHRSYTLDQFEQALPALCQQGVSIMYYLFPFQDKLMVEFRRYARGGAASYNRWVWPIRNLFWKTVAPVWGYTMTRWVAMPTLRYALIDGFYSVIRKAVCLALRNERTIASDQIIRYPEHKGISKYTFSIWAFPEQEIMPTMRAYYAFCQDYFKTTGFRCNMLNVGYRIQEDQNPLFSYSWGGTVMTLDPVHTGGPGWDDFLRAYNDFCSEHNGVPLFNQSKWLTRQQVRKAFGTRVDEFWQARTELDPDNRFLNQYFLDLLSA